MVLDKLLEYGFFVVIGAIIVFKVIQVRWKVHRGEALFRSMFPELQPHLHPQKMLDFVVARLARGGKPGVWEHPPGFADLSARISKADDREQVALLDASGAQQAQFVFEKHAEGGVLRVGKGKVTVSSRDLNNQRVRYWHPDREFKWKRRGGVWSFTSRMAEREIDSRDSDRTSFSSDSSSSYDSSGARTAAAAAGIAAAGGTFDGGGASAAWDGAGSGRGGASPTAY